METQKLLRKIENGHSASIISAWYDEATDKIFSGGTDGSIAVWRFSTGTFVKRIIQAHKESVLNIRSDSRYIVSGSKDKTVKLWNVNTYELKWTVSGHATAVLSVRLSENFVVSSSGDTHIRIWSVENGELVRVLSGHQRGVASIEIVGDAAMIVSGSSDESVRVWDVKSGEELEMFKAHSNLVRSVVVKTASGGQDDGQGFDGQKLERIASGSYDGTVSIWGKGLTPWDLTHKLSVEEARKALGITDHADDPVGLSCDRIYSVQWDDKRIICCGQKGTIVGWEFGS